ncbi:PREDICTED: random slug protein 5-like isoform X1 [Nicotiana attenuata]|uniref:Phosphatidylinositolphosphatidylcholine transfer protein sfh1 n=1 Tax=Nicotiana attenuata TaxID=49451 RepID=A0A1J6IMQ2_NICAT|nr:PREDICTED: random slug protein 5-like isoform X1 [Nicotiana attenuata]OIT05548.1 phosphatidylinositolphosphatidylcholine transfer protein sfh1 [Nicotiana attenuata]
MEGKVKAVAKELNNNGIHFETKLQQEEESVTQEIQVKCDDKISEEEKNKICLMRALVEKQDPSSKEVDDYEIRRFLRARELDVDKASAMLLKCLKWKKNIAPNGTISASEAPNEIAHNKMFMQGVDKQGRPIAVILGARHFHNKLGGPDELKRFVVLALDKLCSRTSPGREKFVAIVDLQGFGYANSDARAYIGALSILQDCYPERLEKILGVHIPYLFWTLWKIISPFIDNKTKKKIIFVENKRLMTTLLQDIDESQIPEIYGGKMPLVPIHEA